MTASAAEIVAAALQDYSIALIVGDERTYGKGSIQMQTVTDNKKKDLNLKVTVGQYYSVSGQPSQLQGVKSDIVVPGPLLHEKLGEEYLLFPIPEDKQLDPAFEDSLSDIKPEMKQWYIRYYLPYLQEKKAFAKGAVEQLRQASEKRQAENQGYQMLLHKESLTDEEKKRLRELQLQEALLIMQELISKESS
jgi:carboxyl-terminal processing protease